MNYERFLNRTARSRQANIVRESYEKMVRSGVPPSEFINMSGGMPNVSMFPFLSADIKLHDGTTISLGEDLMKEALQYGPSPGYPPLVSQVKEIIREFHNPPTMDKPGECGLEVFIIPGSQDGILKNFEMLVERGDNVLLESPTYIGAMCAVKPMGCNLMALPTDDKGVIPAELREMLSRWKPSDAKNPNSDIPKIMYTVPNGGNPSGATISKERRYEIYQIAREYDLLIIEDDPYYFVNFAPEKLPSFLSMDVDGRVIRLDSFSKIISSGLRVGFISGPKPLLQRYLWHQQISMQNAASLSQVMLSELLKQWGKEGLKKQTDKCREFYERRRNVLLECVKKHLTGLAEWNEPCGGMFLWLKVKDIEDTRKMVEGPLYQKRVIFAQGCGFESDPDKPCPFLRIAYSLCSPEEMDKAIRCLAEAIKEELATKKQ